MDKETRLLIINALRQATIMWSGRKVCLENARQKFRKGTTAAGVPVFKLYWQCAECKCWFRNETDVEVDHIEEIGSFNGSWDEYIGRMFCGPENLQALCLKCHEKKTSRFNVARKGFTRKPPRE